MSGQLRRSARAGRTGGAASKKRRPRSPQAPSERKPRLSLRSRPSAIAEAPVEVEAQAAKALPEDSPAPTKRRRPRKSTWFMKLIPPSLVRLHQLKKKRRNKATTIVPITNKPEEQPENLQGLCSLGCTSCQRFNNIRCFMIFYCILLVAQGEPEGEGEGVVWGRGKRGPPGLVQAG